MDSGATAPMLTVASARLAASLASCWTEAPAVPGWVMVISLVLSAQDQTGNGPVASWGGGMVARMRWAAHAGGPGGVEDDLQNADAGEDGIRSAAIDGAVRARP